MTGRDSQEMVEPRVFVNLAVPQWGEGHVLSCHMMSHHDITSSVCWHMMSHDVT